MTNFIPPDNKLNELDALDFWRLCDELSIIQAALLTIGVNPESTEGVYCEDWKPEERPKGYEAAKTAITNALRKGVIEGRLTPIVEFDWNGQPNGYIDGSINIIESSVIVESLKVWLAQRGLKTGFFAPITNSTPDYLDTNSLRYAPKLAAAIHAWLSVTDPGKRSPKQALEKWLREHAADFGLVDDEGNPINQAVEDCSKVANWNQTGGAPKTPEN